MEAVVAVTNEPAASGAGCRSCGAALSVSFCDLGCTPLANAMVKPQDLARGETFYPLHAWVCDACFLVQLEEFRPPDEIFSDYLYFSSFSPSWLAHARDYAEAMIARWGLGPDSRVVEIASNDGYLLKNFVAAGVPCLGIDPARADVCQHAEPVLQDRHVDVGRHVLDDHACGIEPVRAETGIDGLP